MQTVTLDQALTVVQQLQPTQRHALLEILRQQEIEEWQDQVQRNAAQAQLDYEAGILKPKTVAQIMKEARE